MRTSCVVIHDAILIRTTLLVLGFWCYCVFNATVVLAVFDLGFFTLLSQIPKLLFIKYPRGFQTLCLNLNLRNSLFLMITVETDLADFFGRIDFFHLHFRLPYDNSVSLDSIRLKPLFVVLLLNRWIIMHKKYKITYILHWLFLYICSSLGYRFQYFRTLTSNLHTLSTST